MELERDDAQGLRWKALTPWTCAMDVEHYWAATVDFEAATEALPWRSDPVLARALQPWRGMRILKQPLGETLLTFLCSPVKRIPQIRACLDALALALGEVVLPGVQALPTWPRLAEASEAQLRACQVGYRAKSIQGTAARLMREPGWLQQVEQLPYAEAHQALLQLPGVGAKIADCVLLYGGGHLQAFPVDTWVAKALTRWYGLGDWSLPQLRQFGQLHFGAHAGLAQQYLFSGMRSGGSDPA